MNSFSMRFCMIYSAFGQPPGQNTSKRRSYYAFLIEEFDGLADYLIAPLTLSPSRHAFEHYWAA